MEFTRGAECGGGQVVHYGERREQWKSRGLQEKCVMCKVTKRKKLVEITCEIKLRTNLLFRSFQEKLQFVEAKVI